MALGSWSTPDGVGFSKKHDAPVPDQRSILKISLWPALRRKRLILIALASVLLYVFVKNIPTDLKPASERYDRFGSLAPGHAQAHAGLAQAQSEGNAGQNTDQKYGAPILFVNLAMTLRSHVTWSNDNDNILIAVPELSSLSNLVPTACEMAVNNRSTIHVALLGRQHVGVKDIMSINGLSSKDCPVIWHDARPDHPLESSEDRILASIGAGFGHCITALRPQTVLLDSGVGKNAIVRSSLREISNNAGVPVVTLPGDIMQAVPWVTALDSSSLQKLNEVELEIVVQAYSESAGPLIRLLRSLETANYNGLFFPKLTVELPAQIDPFLSSYLQAYRWPPDSTPSASKLTLRHRLDFKAQSATQASLRTLESFYPHIPSTSHVLLLSPDVEVSQSYLHYLLFTLLEYRYGQNHNGLTASLFGISLELPSTKLSSTKPFINKAPPKKSPLLLSQAPNRNAVLVFGDGWADLHKFLASRVARDTDLVHRSESASSVTQEHPAWLAEMVDFLQARNHYVLYPAFAVKNELRLAKVHKDLHQPPEEYAKKKEEGTTAKLDMSNVAKNDVLTDDINLSTRKNDAAPMAFSFPLQVLLPPRGKKNSQRGLPSLSDIPLFTFDGQPTDWSESRRASAKFADTFSLQQGDCKTLEDRDKQRLGEVDYLFCQVG